MRATLAIGGLEEESSAEISRHHLSADDHHLEPRFSLASLPHELIALIATFCDRSDAISLALTRRYFLNPAEPAIWRTIDTTLNAHFGEYPLIRPFTKNNPSPYHKWVDMITKEAEERRKKAAKGKLQKLILQAGKSGRVRKVQEVTIQHRPGSIYDSIRLLELVSRTLTSIHLSPNPDDYKCEAWPSPIRQVIRHSLDFKLLDAEESFPNLTYLHLGRNSVYISNSIPLWCMAAPNLKFLDVENQTYLQYYSDQSLFPILTETTKIDRMRLAFNEWGEGTYHEDDDSYPPLISILHFSPLLRQLSLQYFTFMESPTWPAIITELSALEVLKDLHLTVNPSFMKEIGFGVTPIISVRRLVLETYRWSEIFRLPSGFPAAEVICYIHSSRKGGEEPPTLSHHFPSPVYAMTPLFARQLRAMPRLHTIQTISRGEYQHTGLEFFDKLDHMERDKTVTGVVRSIRHDGGELLHVRLLLNHMEIEDAICHQRPVYNDWDSPILPYTAEDGTRRQKVFAKLRTPVWIDMTDYEGTIVPLRIIDKVKHLEGASDGYWDQRGAGVRANSWKVLEDWKRRLDERKKGKKT